MTIQRVVLVGAGGGLGPHILSALLESGFDVTALTRKSSTSTIPSGVRVATVSDSYPYAELVPIFQGQDAVILSIAATALAVQTNIVDAAVQARVQRFIPCEFGIGDVRGETLEHPVFRGKHDVRMYLQSKESTGMSWTGVSCGAFLDSRLYLGVWRFDVEKREAAILDSGDKKWAASTWRTIATATVGALKHLEETKNRFVWVRSFFISQNELLAELEKATGAKWSTQRVQSGPFIEENRKLLKEKGGNAAVLEGENTAALNLIWTEAVGVEDWEKTHGLDNDLLEVPREDFSKVIARAVKDET
ncbi:hypothetical protein MMC10_001702 [Thelotrema lepadinum]|nr:hypothetical protein [Thelotrema lepadinum]